MIAVLLMATSSVVAAPSATWAFRIQQNLLNQPEAIAELTGAQTPGSYIRVSCSALDGPKTTIGLGFRPFVSPQKSDGEMQRERLKLSTEYELEIDASLDPNEPLIETYVATGNDALKAARQLADSRSVSVQAGTVSVLFSYGTKATVVQNVIDACPFGG